MSLPAEQVQEKAESRALGHRATVEKCLRCFDADGHVTLRAHGQAVTRIVALAEQVVACARSGNFALHLAGKAYACSASDQHTG
jgi:hypothetical protein